MKPKTNYQNDKQENLTGLLTVFLADEVNLYTKTRKIRLSNSGETSLNLYHLLDEQYKHLAIYIDEIGDRIKIIGSNTSKESFDTDYRQLDDSDSGKENYSINQLKELLSDHNALIKLLRKHIASCDKQYKDSETTGILKKLLQEHKIIARDLKGHLKQ